MPAFSPVRSASDQANQLQQRQQQWQQATDRTPVPIRGRLPPPEKKTCRTDLVTFSWTAVGDFFPSALSRGSSVSGCFRSLLFFSSFLSTPA